MPRAFRAAGQDARHAMPLQRAQQVCVRHTKEAGGGGRRVEVGAGRNNGRDHDTNGDENAYHSYGEEKTRAKENGVDGETSWNDVVATEQSARSAGLATELQTRAPSAASLP